MDFALALEGATLALQDGVDKYGRGNWAKGMPQDEIIDSLLRHVLGLKKGETVDPQSKNGATHWDCIVSNSLMLSQLRPQVAGLQAAATGQLDDQGGGIDGDGVYRIDGYDADGFDIAGFDHDGVHRDHDQNNQFCNCPSCR